jgi:hypothetical protein
MAEFALVAPLFFMLLFGIIEAGRFVFYYEILNNATREGARYAIVNGANSLDCPTGPPANNSRACDTTGDDVVQKVRDAAVGVLGSSVAVTPCWYHSGGNCEPSPGDGDNGRGATVTVRATYTYSSLIPIVPLPNISIEAESSLVINN